MKKVLSRSLILLFILATAVGAHAQTAKLSIQGILKKLDGNAVDNGTYTLRFRLYTQESGGTSIWEETQSDIEVNNGIYSAVLGSAQPLNVAFDTTYWLGVAVGGGPEMTPRAELTTAPYALSLIGQTNKFPSTGRVEADSIVTRKLRGNGGPLPVEGAILARGGAPGSNNSNNNGFAFQGNSGDNDSGLFSTAQGSVSLYSNNTEVLKISAVSGSSTQLIDLNGRVNTNLTMNSGDAIQYHNGSETIKDWRLVDTDDFTGGATENWQVSTGLYSGTLSNATSVDFGDFNGSGVRQTSSSQVLKKSFNPDENVVGAFDWVKVKFKYYILDDWDAGAEVAIGGFMSSSAGSITRICWQVSPEVYAGDNRSEINFFGQQEYSDGAVSGEMIMRVRDTNAFWVFFGSRVNESDELFGISNIEVWVR
ncbi:MAG: hypothetical protein SFV52_03160 [Saprospiraceae bacterium]|nr:hypothetical protein [Saprospiraceae bacterium]